MATTMNVSLTDDLSAFVAEQIEEGGYNNQSEVVRDSLRQMRERKAKLQYLRETVGKAVADVESGRSKVLTKDLLREIGERGRQRAAARKKSGA